jgi:hypothetical protein
VSVAELSVNVPLRQKVLCDLGLAAKRTTYATASANVLSATGLAFTACGSDARIAAALLPAAWAGSRGTDEHRGEHNSSASCLLTATRLLIDRLADARVA